MASKVTYNDFRGGMLSERMRRRTDLENFYSTASLIRNAVPMRAGGLRLRPGMRVAGLLATHKSSSRVFTYTVSFEESYSVVVSPGQVYVYAHNEDGTVELAGGGSFYAPYTADDIPEIVTTQNYECMVFCQRNYPPYILSKKKGESGVSFSKISLVTKTDRVGDDGSEFVWSYDGLFTESDFPSTCAFMAERLWLMGSKEHPSRMWASRPYDIFNFQTKDWYSYLDESTTVEQYMKALEEYSSRSEEIESDSSIYYSDTKEVSIEGYVTITRGIKDYNTGEFLEVTDTRLTSAIGRKYDLVKTMQGPDGKELEVWYNPKVESFYYKKTVTKWDQVVREDCALELDPSSDRDESISWLGYAGSAIYVGTTSSEWAIPSEVSAINVKKDKMGSYGSAAYRQCAYGANSLFYIQSGSRRLRAITTTSDGTVFNEPTFQAEDIFSGEGRKIKEIAWQRVPEPRLYATLEDGSMAVLSYDQYYGMNAWCEWKSDAYKVLSTSIRDTEDGQEVVCLVEDAEGKVSFGIFEDGLLKDGDTAFKAEIVTNNIDSQSTLAYRKAPYNVYLDTMQTEFRASQNGLAIQSSRNYERDLVKLALSGSPTTDGLRIRIESMEGKPFTLLAIVIEVEVS